MYSPIRPLAYPPAHLPTYPPTHQPTYPPTYLPSNLPTHQSTHPPTHRTYVCANLEATVATPAEAGSAKWTRALPPLLLGRKGRTARMKTRRSWYRAIPHPGLFRPLGIARADCMKSSRVRVARIGPRHPNSLDLLRARSTSKGLPGSASGLAKLCHGKRGAGQSAARWLLSPLHPGRCCRSASRSRWKAGPRQDFTSLRAASFRALWLVTTEEQPCCARLCLWTRWRTSYIARRTAFRFSWTLTHRNRRGHIS